MKMKKEIICFSNINLKVLYLLLRLINLINLFDIFLCNIKIYIKKVI